MKHWQTQLADWQRSFWGAVLFYTILPLPMTWGRMERIARWAPAVGLAIGASLAAAAAGLQALGMPMLARSTLIVTLGWAISGGLHLDGAIDTADGWAVGDPERRLAAMQDSRVGAFGVMAAIAIALLKIAALSEPALATAWALPAVAAWGRWGQVVAIARYPYLKPDGKGAFHQRHLQLPQDLLFSTLTVLSFSALHIYQSSAAWPLTVSSHLCSSLLAVGSGAAIQHHFGGHTGDTYGAVVEWTEALSLVAIATLSVR